MSMTDPSVALGFLTLGGLDDLGPFGFCRVVTCKPLVSALQLPAVSQAWIVYVYGVEAVRPVSE